jgi:hypothetical protein
MNGITWFFIFLLILVIGYFIVTSLTVKVDTSCPDNCNDSSCTNNICTKCAPAYGDLNSKPINNVCPVYKQSCPDNCKDVICTNNICIKCAPGYGDKDRKPINNVCPVNKPIYTVVGTSKGNKCSANLINSLSASESACKYECTIDDTCTGYDWGEEYSLCDLWSGVIKADSGTKDYTCYQKTTF